MSKEDLSKVLGRALLDHKFLDEVQKDPAAAAKSIGAMLTPEEEKALRDLSLGQIHKVAASLRADLPTGSFFDQQDKK